MTPGRRALHTPNRGRSAPLHTSVGNAGYTSTCTVLRARTRVGSHAVEKMRFRTKDDKIILAKLCFYIL